MKYLVTYTVRKTVTVEAESESDAISALHITRDDFVACEAIKPTGVRRWTIADIWRMNRAGGGHFFSPANMRFAGDTMRSFRVVNRDGQIIVERKRDGIRWQFSPETGGLRYVGTAQAS